MIKELAHELKNLFDSKAYLWMIDGRRKSPTRRDMEDFLSEVTQWFEGKEDGTWFESGRLIFIKDGDNLDVYALQGTLKISKDDS